VEEFQLLKMEVLKEQFGLEIHVALLLIQQHTQLTMTCYFNKTAMQGADRGLPTAVPNGPRRNQTKQHKYGNDA
jgi:hypothetical protein